MLAATNAWLHAQSQRGDGRFDRDRGHVCCFSALVFKGREVHLLHVGDTRVYRLHPGALEQLSLDHRVRVDGQTCLGRALGVSPHVEVDHASWPTEVGETFLLASDGAYEHLDAALVHEVLARCGAGLQAASEALVAAALAAGSPDNATVMLARVEALPTALAPAVSRDGLKLPPHLAARQDFEGYRVVRELHVGARSQVVLAVDAGGREWALKLPSAELAGQACELDRFALEEWVARRVDSPHALRAAPATASREHLFTAMEFLPAARRQQALSEFVHDLEAPGAEFTRHRRTPLQQRHPLLFWRGLTLLFGLSTLLLLGLRLTGR